MVQEQHAQAQRMAPKWFHDSLILLPLLLVSFAAVRQTAEEFAYQEAAALCERGHWSEAGPYIDAALLRLQGSDADPVWGLRILRGRVLIARNDAPAAIAALPRVLPRRLARSSFEVLRLTYLGGANYRVMNDVVAEALLARAEKLARAHHPRTIAEVLLYRASFEYHRKRYTDAVRYARASLDAARRYHQTTAQISAMMTGALVLTSRSITTRP